MENYCQMQNSIPGGDHFDNYPLYFQEERVKKLAGIMNVISLLRIGMFFGRPKIDGFITELYI